MRSMFFAIQLQALGFLAPPSSALRRLREPFQYVIIPRSFNSLKNQKIGSLENILLRSDDKSANAVEHQERQYRNADRYNRL